MAGAEMSVSTVVAACLVLKFFHLFISPRLFLFLAPPPFSSFSSLALFFHSFFHSIFLVLFPLSPLSLSLSSPCLFSCSFFPLLQPILNPPPTPSPTFSPLSLPLSQSDRPSTSVQLEAAIKQAK